MFPAGTNFVTTTAFYGTNVLNCTFHVVVLVRPAITSQPSNVTVSAGTPTNLTAQAQGSAPLAYQWTFEGVPILSATNAALSLSNPQSVNEGFYRVIVTNVAGSVTSAPALLRVLPAAPAIVSGPDSRTVSAGSNVVFALVLKGSSPLVVQWFHDGLLEATTAAPQLVISNAQSVNAGDYYVVVSNALGMATSGTATLTVLPAAPVFTLHPPSFVLGATGSNLVLTVAARGSEPIAYQWRRNGTPLTNANQPTLVLSNLTTSLNGNYDALATNLFGKATSHVCAVSISGTPPSFTQQPASIEVLEGSPVTLNSLASGTAPLRYFWYFQNAPLATQTNRQLVLASVASAQAGSYHVLASNFYGMATSVVAQVTVNQSLVISQPLSNYVVDVGSTIALTVGATSTNNIGYRWQFNGAALPETNSTLTLTNISLSRAGYYWVTVSNQYGSLSSTGRVSVFGPASWVIGWGDDSGGQADIPTNLDQVVAISAGDFHSVALRHDGLIAAWGFNGDGQTNVPVSSQRFVAVASGAAHNLAITEDGSVIAWGRNDSGQTAVPAAAASTLAVAAGDSHSVAVLASGRVLAWGDNSLGQTNIPGSLSGVRTVSAGRNHTLALRADGTVAAWGFNTFGQASPPPGLSSVQAIAAGYLHSAVLLSNGAVTVWGNNSFGQTNVPAGLSNVVAIAAGDYHTLALKADGSIVGWGDNSFGQLQVPPGTMNAAALAAGYYHGLALVPPLLRYDAASGALILRWDGPGVLQGAPGVDGPFTDLPGSGRSYTNTDFSAPARFFRLRR